MKKTTIICLLVFLGIGTVFSNPPKVIDYTVTKIWDKAPHSAFTDLIDFKGHFYCAFREGTGHIPDKDGSGDGEIRILVSDDGTSWKSAALLTKKGFDLRDAKLSVTPDGRLMVLMGGSIYDKAELQGRITQVSFSDKKGENFSDPQPVSIEAGIRSKMDWLWRVTWYKKTGYGVIYQYDREKEWLAFLVKTTDGVNYQSVTRLEVTGKPNEATVDFSKSGEMRILMRREGGDANGWLGYSNAPYKEWKWTDLGIRLGGPNMINLPDGKILIGTRSYEKNTHYTSLYSLDRQGKAKQLLHLPSDGDNSYPGFVVRGDVLWVSYYSGHEGRTSIYLARMNIKDLFINDRPIPVLASKQIWNVAPHNAFTDIIRWNGAFYCSFREGDGHIPIEKGNVGNGKIRIIRSVDGENWESAALLSTSGIDLRDPKMAVMPDGRLMFNCGGSDYSDGLQEWFTHVAFSKNGVNWTAPKRVKGIPGDNWFFRITWHNQEGYVAANICKSDPATGQVIINNRQLILYKTRDGLNYEPVSGDIGAVSAACEATLRFKQGKMFALVRRENAKIQDGFLLITEEPYQKIANRHIYHTINGPNMFSIDENTWLVGTRETEWDRADGKPGTGTVLLLMDDLGNFRRIYELPSGGDTSYPGFVVHDNQLWISYYSSHEGKSSIYLSKIPLSELK